MAKNYIVARVGRCTRSDATRMQNHNDRRRKAYKNPDIIQERSALNQELIEGWDGSKGYTEVFDEMLQQGKISTSGLRGDAVLFNELLHDVNSEYWLGYEQHGYESPEEFAMQYFKDCLEFDKQKYGEDKILSAKVHFDEINRELTEKYGRPVYHYHMHVVAIPTVTKEKKWTKRCKDPELVGTVKERITQVSDSNFWAWKTGEEKSFAAFQTDIYNYLRPLYPDLSRGEKGSKKRHFDVEEYKVLQAELRNLRTQNQELTAKYQDLTAKCQALSKHNDEMNQINSKNLAIIKENEQIITTQIESLQLIRSFDQYLQEAQEVNDNLDTLEETTQKLPEAAKLFKASEAHDWVREMLWYIKQARRMISVGIHRLKIFESVFDVPERLSEPAQKRAAALDEQIDAASQRAGTFRNESLERSR